MPTASHKSLLEKTTTEDRARTVLFKAAELFHQQGYDATSMNDIARAVDLTKAGLYYYTKGKEDLLFKIVDYAMACVEKEIIEPAMEIAAPRARLAFIIENHLRKIFEMGGAITVLTVEVAKLQPAQEKKITARQRAYLDLMVSTIGELKDSKIGGDMDARLAALNVFSCILGATRWYKPKGRFKQDRIVKETIRFIESGLMAK